MTDDRSEFPSTPEEIRADRDVTRQELEQTISELTEKVDIPARAEEKIHDTAQAARQRTTEAGQHARDAAARTRAKAGELVTNAAPSIAEPLSDVGKHVQESVRSNRVPVAVLAAVFAAVLTWAVLRRRRS